MTLLFLQSSLRVVVLVVAVAVDAVAVDVVAVVAVVVSAGLSPAVCVGGAQKFV